MRCRLNGLTQQLPSTALACRYVHEGLLYRQLNRQQLQVRGSRGGRTTWSCWRCAVLMNMAVCVCVFMCVCAWVCNAGAGVLEVFYAP